VAEIEKSLHQKLPIAALFQLTTVAQVAEVIRQSDSQLRHQTSDLKTNDRDIADNNGKSSSWPELPIEDYRALLTTHAHWKSPRLGTKSLVLETQAGNPQQKLPILAVGGMGDLHHHLPSDQPVYSLPVHTHVKTHQIYIKALAGCYVEEILSIQPQGPYILFGYCFGGTVALEIAQQLQAQGKEIALLILVERPSFDSVYKYYLKIMRPLISNWRQLLQRNLPQQKTYLIQKSKNLLNKILSKFKKQVQSSLSSSPNSKTNSTDNFKVNQNYEITYTKDIHLAQKNYVPEPYRGRVALYFSHEGARTSWLYPRAGWGKLMRGEVEVEIIPGSTNGLLIEPNVKILAKKLEDKGVKGLQ
jgi:thioesterase domain-containing protein